MIRLESSIYITTVWKVVSAYLRKHSRIARTRDWWWHHPLMPCRGIISRHNKWFYLGVWASTNKWVSNEKKSTDIWSLPMSFWWVNKPTWISVIGYFLRNRYQNTNTLEFFWGRSRFIRDKKNKRENSEMGKYWLVSGSRYSLNGIAIWSIRMNIC